MITHDEMHQILCQAIRASSSVDCWCKENGLEKQRQNVNDMVNGKRKISSTVAGKLGYRAVSGFEKK